jgi:hypothetical protein
LVQWQASQEGCSIKLQSVFMTCLQKEKSFYSLATYCRQGWKYGKPDPRLLLLWWFFFSRNRNLVTKYSLFLKNNGNNFSLGRKKTAV